MDRLQAQVQQLESQFRDLVKERELLERKFLLEANQSLSLATSTLRDLIDVVAGLDKQLLYWYHGKRKPLRIAMKPLKLIGRDRDADTLVRKNVDVIALRANTASAAFNGCADLCHASLKEVRVLHLRTNDFIHRSIQGVQQQAQELTLSHQRKKEDLQLQIDQTNVDMDGVRDQERRSRWMVERLEEQANEAARASRRTGWFGGLSILSGIAIAVTCVFAPPVGIAAVAAGATALGGGLLGASSVANSVDHKKASSRLRQEAAGYDSKVQTLQSQARYLRSQIALIEYSKGSQDESIRAIAEIDQGCQQLHGQTTRLVGELVFAQDRISEGVLRMRAIASGLHMSTYGRTRVKLVDNIRAMVTGCASVLGDSSSGTLALTGDWAPIERGLEGLERDSFQVARIVAKYPSI